MYGLISLFVLPITFVVLSAKFFEKSITEMKFTAIHHLGDFGAKMHTCDLPGSSTDQSRTHTTSSFAYRRYGRLCVAGALISMVMLIIVLAISIRAI